MQFSFTIVVFPCGGLFLFGIAKVKNSQDVSKGRSIGSASGMALAKIMNQN